MTDWERRKTLRPGRGPSLDVDSRQDELDKKETSSRGRHQCSMRRFWARGRWSVGLESLKQGTAGLGGFRVFLHLFHRASSTSSLPQPSALCHSQTLASHIPLSLRHVVALLPPHCQPLLSCITVQRYTTLSQAGPRYCPSSTIKHPYLSILSHTRFPPL